MRRVYLDHSATTPVDPEVAKLMMTYYTEKYGNPSSVHSFGRDAKAALENARESVAKLLGAQPTEITFTSGGTEADNLAIIGTAEAQSKKENISSLQLLNTTLSWRPVNSLRRMAMSSPLFRWMKKDLSLLKMLKRPFDPIRY